MRTDPLATPYPVINAGVRIRLDPVALEDYVASYGGGALVDQLRAIQAAGPASTELDQRARATPAQPPLPATHALLLAEESLLGASVPEPHRRNALEQAINHLISDRTHAQRDRLTALAGITLHSPREGITQLEFAVKRLGLKAVVIPSQLPFNDPETSPDRPEDYDPFWARAVELGVPVFIEGRLPALRRLPSLAGEVSAALYLTGVLHRFPDLRLVFLGRRAGWARRFYRSLAQKLEADRLASGWLDGFCFGAESLDQGLAGNLESIYAAPTDRVPTLAPALIRNAELQQPLRAFLFESSYRLCTAANPHFFAGTTVERELSRWQPPAAQDPVAA